MSISNAIMDSHEPTLQFTHSLNRVMQSYGMEIQSIDFYYSDDNFTALLEAELKGMLEDPMDPLAREAIVYALNTIPAIHGLSASQGALHPATFAQVGTYLSKMELFTASAKAEALIGVSANVYYVNFRTARR